MVAAGFAVVVGVGVWFVYSGLAKHRTGTFAADLAEYRILPQPSIRPIATLLPSAEILLGLCLLLGVASALFLTLAAILLITFSAAMVVNLRRGRRISCGCRGASETISWRLVGQNMLVAATSFGVALSVGAPGLGDVVTGSPRMSRIDALGVLISLACFAVVLRLAAAAYRLAKRISGVTFPVQPGSSL